MEGIEGQGTSAIAPRINEILPQSELLAAIVASAQEAIISKTLDGVITSWNPAAERIYGFSAEEAIGKKIFIIVPPENWDHVAWVEEKLAAGESVPPFETIQVHKDGRRLEVLVSVSAIKDSSGTVIGTSSLNTDITGQKWAEERLRIAGQSLSIGSWDWNIRTNQMSWSPKMQEMHHFAQGEVQGAFDIFIQDVHPEDREKVLQTLADVQQNPGEFCLEYRMAKDEKVWFEARGRVLLDRDGKAERMIGICLDISQRKAAEEALLQEAALRESEARLRELAEAMPHMVWIADPHGKTTYANQRYFEYTGASGLESVPLDPRFVHPEDQPRVTERWREILRGSVRQQFELRFLGQTGLYHWHLVRMVPIKDEHSQIIRWIGTATDINRQARTVQAMKISARSLEHKVKQRTAELNQSVKFLEQFLYNMGHHLRAPLRTIVGFTRILLEENASAFNAEGRDYAQRVVDAGTRMDQLLNDLIAFGQIDHRTVDCTPVDLDLCVKEVLHQFAREIEEKNAKVEVHHPLPPVCAHKAETEVILSNLISNALKFVRPGTSPDITISAKRKDDLIRLWIVDKGIGIPAEHQRRIFQPFERLHGYGEFPGTGMGLATVKQSVEKMGGCVGLSSEPGKGSSFWIELPVDVGSIPCPSDSQPGLGFLPENDLLVVTDTAGRIRWVNDAFTQATGYARNEIFGKKPGTLLQGAATDSVEIQKLRDAIHAHKKCTVAVVNYRKTGEPFWVLIALGPISRDGRQVGFAAVERKITLPISDAQKLELRHNLRRVIARLRKMPEVV